MVRVWHIRVDVCLLGDLANISSNQVNAWHNPAVRCWMYTSAYNSFIWIGWFILLGG
jgi:hypothetical protein